MMTPLEPSINYSPLSVFNHSPLKFKSSILFRRGGSLLCLFLYWLDNTDENVGMMGTMFFDPHTGNLLQSFMVNLRNCCCLFSCLFFSHCFIISTAVSVTFGRWEWCLLQETSWFGSSITALPGQLLSPHLQ